MKKDSLIPISVLLLVLLSSCGQNSQNSSSSISSNGGSVTVSQSSGIGSEISSSQNPSSSLSSAKSLSSASLSSSSAEVESLASKELYYLSNASDYGNTNGNANNHGQVVYDRVNKIHYFAFGSSVYSYSPATKTTAKVFSSQDEGTINNLCLTSSDLYFVSSLHHYLYRYNFTSHDIVLVSQNETSFLTRYSSKIYTGMTKIQYDEPVTGLGIYQTNNQSFMTNFSGGATNVNLNGMKIVYTTNNGPIVQLMADTFNGKTNIRDYDSLGLDEILSLHVISESSNQYWVAIQAKVGSLTKIYLTFTGSETLTEIATGSDISGINSDDKHLFFLKNGELMSYTLADNTLQKIANVDTRVKQIYVINYWLYLSSENHDLLFRINPDTKIMETNFWTN